MKDAGFLLCRVFTFHCLRTVEEIAILTPARSMQSFLISLGNSRERRKESSLRKVTARTAIRNSGRSSRSRQRRLLKHDRHLDWNSRFRKSIWRSEVLNRETEQHVGMHEFGSGLANLEADRFKKRVDVRLRRGSDQTSQAESFRARDIWPTSPDCRVRRTKKAAREIVADRLEESANAFLS